MVWYSTQQFSVKWDGILSEPFNVTNGVRQGSILSPQLFNVYMDELSDHMLDVTTIMYVVAIYFMRMMLF
jgi:hypothetical protein